MPRKYPGIAKRSVYTSNTAARRDEPGGFFYLNTRSRSGQFRSLQFFAGRDTLLRGGILMDGTRVRICDIAQELGVSTATVSNVIHGKTGKVSPETVRQVQALLEKRQYIPSMAGVLLARNTSKIIGVVICDHEKYEGRPLEDPFLAAALNALNREIRQAGYFLMVRTAADTEEIVRLASMWNMDGLVIIGFCEQDYRTLRSAMRIPFVVYDGDDAEPDRYYNLVIDDFDGGYQAGQHLKRLGHRKALCLSDNLEHVDLERIRGFEAGFGPAEHWLIPLAAEERSGFYEANLEKLRQFTAVFAVSDFYAAELMQLLQARGVEIPRELSVMGFDDGPICRWCRPALTTIRQDAALRARLAVEKLRQLRTEQGTGGTVRIPVQLVVRESTGAACH